MLTAREFYNDSVTVNNVRMEQVPDMFFTGLASMQKRSLFEAAPDERQDVDVASRLAR